MNRTDLASTFAVESLFSPGECDALLAVWKAFPEYRTSSTNRRPRHAEFTPGSPRPGEVRFHGRADSAPDSPVDPGSTPLGFHPDLASRPDAGRNFLRTGGRMGSTGESRAKLRARNDYFRENYAFDGRVGVPGIESVMYHEALADTARRLFGLPVVVARIVYANVLLPGQELGLHTDVPEFRLERSAPVPIWLRVVMHHSGLFDDWRIPVATAVIFMSASRGGEFAFFPCGPEGPAETIRPGVGSAFFLDAETIFHGVDRVGGPDEDAPPTGTGSRLIFRGDDRWEVTGTLTGTGSDVVSYTSDQIRFSLSWKAYCFADETDLNRWKQGAGVLPTEDILPRLVSELERRGALPSGRSGIDDTALGLLLIDEFIRFPVVSAVSRWI